MKIQSGGVNNPINVGAAKNDKVDGKTADKTGKAQASDLSSSAKVDISERAQMINKIKALATPDMDEVREDKVAYFQNLIDKGEYKVDAAGVADRMVDEHLIG